MCANCHWNWNWLTSSSSAIMSSYYSTYHSKRIRILAWTGVVLLLGGIALYWAATPMSRVYLTRDMHGSFSQIDGDRQDLIKFLGDRLLWVGLGLILTSSIAWVNNSNDETGKCEILHNLLNKQIGKHRPYSDHSYLRHV